MGTVTLPEKRKTTAAGGTSLRCFVVSDHAISRSLGIYTKIDFDAKEVLECHSTSSIFRGYLIFMKNKKTRRVVTSSPAGPACLWR